MNLQEKLNEVQTQLQVEKSKSGVDRNPTLIAKLEQEEADVLLLIDKEKRIQEIQIKLTELDPALEDENNQISQLQSELNQLQNELNLVEQVKQEHEEILARVDVDTDLANLVVVIGDEPHKLSTLFIDDIARDCALNDLRLEFIKAKKNIVHELEGALNRESVLQHQNNAKQNAIDALTKELAELKAKNAQLENELQDRETKLQNAANEIELLRNQSEQSNTTDTDDINELERRLQEAKDKRNEEIRKQLAENKYIKVVKMEQRSSSQLFIVHAGSLKEEIVPSYTKGRYILCSDEEAAEEEARFREQQRSVSDITLADESTENEGSTDEDVELPDVDLVGDQFRGVSETTGQEPSGEVDKTQPVTREEYEKLAERVTAIEMKLSGELAS